jgi:hypothetical protein
LDAVFAELFTDFTDFAGFWDFSDFLDFTFDFIWLRARVLSGPPRRGPGSSVSWVEGADRDLPSKAILTGWT